MGRRGPPADFQQLMPLTKFVRWLMITNVVIWFVGTLIVEQYFMKAPYITEYLGLTPMHVIRDLFVWQPFTYLFIHAVNPFHIIFNILLWWVGSQLERLWGLKFFALYYFVSGVGAAVLYLVCALIFSIVKGQPEVLMTPVVGASAALFGLLVAYGIYFGEQVVYFMFFFPMRAKYFVAILGGIEVVMVLNNGLIQGKVANLAHVGGLVSGYVFLKVWPYIGGGQGGNRNRKSRQNKLRLVVNNDDLDRQGQPKYWN